MNSTHHIVISGRMPGKTARLLDALENYRKRLLLNLREAEDCECDPLVENIQQTLSELMKVRNNLMGNKGRG
jgi:hypothetical protein